MAENTLTTKNGALWIQLQAGKASEYFACGDLDAISEPAGDVGLIMCRDANGKYKTVGRTQAAPGAVTTSLSALVYPDADILDHIKNCPVNIFALQRDCGVANVFANYLRGEILSNALVTTRSMENILRNTEDEVKTLRKLDFSADNPVIRVRKVDANRQSIAETTSLNDIAFCNDEQCAGACGSAKDLGESGVTVGNAPAGSPTSKADVWWTEDSGALWQNTLGGAGHPFLVAEDVLSVVCFQVDRLVTRWLVARESTAAAAAVAYSDDGGDTWTSVTVGAILTEGAAWNGALFALDLQHIWFATSEGNVYFSADGGLTWELQDSATASAGKPLNCIKFADFQNGYAVGDDDTIIHTTDGGDTWSAITSPTDATDDLLSLHVFSQYRLIFGDDTGDIWQSWDEGVNWEAKAYSGQAATDQINDMMFVNDLTGFMVQNTNAPVGYVHRSKDGGHTWERLDTPTNAGLNAIWVCDQNLAYAVGSAQGGTSVVLKISG